MINLQDQWYVYRLEKKNTIFIKHHTHTNSYECTNIFLLRLYTFNVNYYPTMNKDNRFV